MKICTNCGYQGKEKTIVKGSLLLEILLWLATLLTLGILVIVALPYSLWRLCAREKVCPKCGALHMIPVDSPRGQQLVNSFDKSEK